MPKTPKWEEIYRKIWQQGPLDLAIRGEISLDEALEEMVREGNRIISEEW